jgi:VIT1/CCC1 family predicted Fe2+/Mn2+ transporter
MKEKYNELDQGIAEQIAGSLSEFRGEMRRLLEDADQKLANFVFLSNGGGAVAVLSYLAAFATKSGQAHWSVFATLAAFCTGLILSGLARYLQLRNVSALHKDANRKHHQFRMNEISVAEASPGYKTPRIWNQLHGYSENSSLLCFIIGVILGIVPVVAGAFAI